MSHFNPRRRPSRSDSQDSFACDPENKPEQQYLARSDKFAVPLSELGKQSSPIRAHSSATASSLYNKDPSPPSGRVLVEATPSHSGSSQHDEPLNLSQQLEATQLVDVHGEGIERKNDLMIIDKDGNGSGYESSEPSSSYRRFLDGERGSELQATQPSTQVHDSSAGPISEDAIPWSNLRSAPHPTASSAPQSLLSMVAPENRWRYRHYLQPGSGVHQNGGIIPFGQTSSSKDRRTPSSFPVSSMGRSFPVPPIGTRDMPPRMLLPSPVQPEAMDIVPDSEPTEEALQMSKMPAVQARQSKSPLTEESDMDLDIPEPNQRIADRKEEEEEEEEEIPLASLAGKHVKNTVATKGKDTLPPGKLPSKVCQTLFTIFHFSYYC